MLHIFRCMMTTHVVVQEDEPYIGTGDRPMCDYCYDQAEAYDSNQTETAFDSVIESVLEGEVYDNYKVLTYDNPVEYKLVKK